MSMNCESTRLINEMQRLAEVWQTGNTAFECTDAIFEFPCLAR